MFLHHLVRWLSVDIRVKFYRSEIVPAVFITFNMTYYNYDVF